jgi:signal transduction histidine kinase
MDRDFLHEELQLRERQIAAINTVAQALFAHTDIDEMLCRTLAVATEVLGAEVGSIQLYDEKNGGELVFRCVFDPAADRLVGKSYPAHDGIGGMVYQSGAGNITQHAEENDRFNPAIDNLTGYRTQSLLTAPLCRFDGHCIGVMQVLNATRPFDKNDLAVLESLGAQAASAIESARLANEARRAGLIYIIGDISHDIKNMLTPLHSGVMSLQMMLESAIAEAESNGPLGKFMESLKTNYSWILEGALDSAERVQTRTRDIANAVKGELTPPNFSCEDVNDVAREVLRALRPVAEASGVELCEAFDAELPHAAIDHKQLFNALYNLVNNALHEMTLGGKVTLETGRHDGRLRIRVSDTGPGIPDHVKAKLFTDAAISTKPGGTGLGTRIVGDVVKRHGGSVELDREIGHGSIFTIHLPFTQPGGVACPIGDHRPA